jgi:two-component system, OmpR family, sensor histidine kinase KdpD
MRSGPAKRGSVPSRSAPERILQFAVVIAIIAGALGNDIVLKQFLVIANVALILLVAGRIVAMIYGLWPALVASVACVLAHNFLFIPPLYSFAIADPQSAVTLLSFAVAALIASNLTSRVRMKAQVARMRAKTNEDLYQYSR